MYVETLKLTNMRAIEVAELKFQPGFNLLVGVNGVGKTTVLDALAFCLSGALREVNALKTAPRAPAVSDIRFGAPALTLECGLALDGKAYSYLVHEPWPDAPVAQSGVGKPREQTHEVMSRREFLGEAPQRATGDEPVGRPIAVLFSTRRASMARSEARPRRAAGGVAAGFAEALEDRGLALAELTDWMRAQEALSEERPESQRVLDALGAAAERFLPGYFNLRVEHNAFAAASAAQAAANAAAAAADPNAAEAAMRAAGFAAEAAAFASAAWILVIDRGQSETVLVESDALTDGERANLKRAIAWTDDWLALHWTGEKLGETPTAQALDDARHEARAAKMAEALVKFLPTCRDLRPAENDEPDAIIDRLPTTLLVSQLSDGERGTLAMVLDLTRRLAQANPHLADPAAEAEAVVLIDEIDLHLHPRWQRDVIHNLIAAFPRCQFIATTHSPQVISEVAHDRVQIMTAEGVYSPDHSFGIDSSRVLEEIMDVPSRPRIIEEKLKEIASLSKPDTLDAARTALGELSAKLELGENDPEVTRLRTLFVFMEGEP